MRKPAESARAEQFIQTACGLAFAPNQLGTGASTQTL